MKGMELADVGVSMLVIILGALTLIYGVTGVFPLDQIGDLNNALGVGLGAFAVAGGLSKTPLVED